MAAPVRAEFRKGMLKEIRDHESRGHRVLVPWSTVSEGATILPAVWSRQRKRVISTGEVHKSKSRLTHSGHKQRKGIDYDKTYSPVVGWPTIRLYLAIFHTSLAHQATGLHPCLPSGNSWKRHVHVSTQRSHLSGTRTICDNTHPEHVWSQTSGSTVLSPCHRLPAEDWIYSIHSGPMCILHEEHYATPVRWWRNFGSTNIS